MDCEELEQLLSRSSVEELAPAHLAAVNAHLAHCAACKEKWDATDFPQELYEAVDVTRSIDRVKGAVMARIAGQGDQAWAKETEPGRRTPRRIGGFELLGRLGRGGMGTVLKARQVSMDRVVALKILSQKLARDEKFVKRFLREARSAARLRHPNIVQAYDAGLADGCYFFAMEYVDGEGLDAVLRREGPLDPGRALGIMEQVASALAAAHEAGIVHRDVKPSNIMIDTEGEARVTDFGLAKRTEGDITITADGKALGTPAYAAPEMARGKGADPRSDLYSLGATFFHVLAGRPPFQGKNFSEVVVKHVTEPPPPLATVLLKITVRV